MRAEAQGERVKILMSWDDPSEYLPALNELVEAQESYDANCGDLSSRLLRPYEARIAAAEGDLDDLFSETLSIESAEIVLLSLQRAVLKAKVERGDFVYPKQRGW